MRNTARQTRWFQSARALIRAVDPCAPPIYIVSARMAKGVAELGPGIGGVTRPLLSSELQVRLRKLGVWKGPGFATVLDLRPCQCREDLEAIVLHEYAHDRLRPAETIEAPFVAQFGREAFDRAIILPPADPHVKTTPANDHKMHPAAFVRVCCHAVHRARAAGWWGEASRVFAGWHYHLPLLWQFGDELGDEPARLCARAAIDGCEHRTARDFPTVFPRGLRPRTHSHERVQE